MSEDHNIGPVDQVKSDALRWATQMGRLAAGYPVNVIWDCDFKTPRGKTSGTLRQRRDEMILDCVEKNRGNQAAAAKELRCSRTTIHDAMRRLGCTLKGKS